MEARTLYETVRGSFNKQRKCNNSLSSTFPSAADGYSHVAKGTGRSALLMTGLWRGTLPEVFQRPQPKCLAFAEENGHAFSADLA